MKAFSIPPHPPALQITKTCIYKTIGRVSIPIDIYVPEGNFHCPPLMLYIHGVSTQLPGAYFLFRLLATHLLFSVVEAHC
jgi:acetyl esterase/lipase